TPLFEGMIADRQPAEEELGAEQVQVDAVVAATVVEDVAKDVAHAEIYNIDLDYSSKVLSMQKDDSEVQDVVEIVTTPKLMTEVVTVAASQGILVEAPKPIKKKDQIEMDEEYARKLQQEIDRDHDGFNKDIDWDAAIDHVNEKSS
nr:hypothetical protein [Tanacetum cinerariifolium]